MRRWRRIRWVQVAGKWTHAHWITQVQAVVQASVASGASGQANGTAALASELDKVRVSPPLSCCRWLSRAWT